MKTYNGSFIRRFDINYRYHIYIADGVLELHTDKYLRKKNGKKFHVASNHLDKIEKKRLKKFIPDIEVSLSETPLEKLDRKAREKLNRKRYKREVFTGDKLKVILQNLNKK